MLGEEDEEEALTEPERAFSTQPLAAPQRDRVRRPGDELRLRVPRLRGALPHGGRRGAVERAARRRRRRRLAGRAGRAASRRPRRSPSTAARSRPGKRWRRRCAIRRARRSRSPSSARARQLSLDGHARSCATTRSIFGEDKRTGLPDRHRGLARLGARRAAACASAWPAQQTATATYLVVQGLVLMVQGRVPLRSSAVRSRSRARRASRRGPGRATSCRCSPSSRSTWAC